MRDGEEPATPKAAEPLPGPGPARAACPVVGVGASAGGLEAFQAFVAAIGPGRGLAYVLVQHLDPNHESLLGELLSRHTSLPISVIEDGTEVRPDRIYLVPPNGEVTIVDGRLRLTAFDAPRGQRRPIDTFFRSLATDQGSNAACVVLSGTGDDGTEGVRTLKAAGGLAIAQDPGQAKYDGMPQSAVATGLVDLIRPSESIPAILDSFFNGAGPRGAEGELEDGFVATVVEAVHFRTGHDFGGYKRGMIARRIVHRMQVVGTADPQDYLRRLMTEDAEGQALFRDLLINVTGFFRDAEAFDALRRRMALGPLAGRRPGDRIRVWVPACSTGEEAYSLAMMLADVAEEQGTTPGIVVFATDIDPTMLATAREGLYPQSAVADLPRSLRDRHFVAEEGGYRVGARLRDMVRFSEHSVIRDPPFSRLDLISCRNMLIYLGPELQSQVLRTFHYALRKGGLLFLGTSENVGRDTGILAPVEPRHRIFTPAPDSVPSVPPTLTGRAPGASGRRAAVAESDGRADFPMALLDRQLRERYAPPFVVLRDRAEVIYSSGRTGRYLEFGPGRPSTKILDLAREGLRSAIRSVLSGIGDGRRAIKRGVELEVDGRLHRLDLCCEALSETTHMVVFREMEAADEQDGADGVDLADFDDEARIRELEDELAETRERLRGAVEELETSNEELKSSNEEMMSMNEELQSANEELSTMNDELKDKIDELAEANDDIVNLLDSTSIAAVFLDDALCIRRFTPVAERLFGLQPRDRGRPIGRIRTAIDPELLERTARAVLSDEVPGEEVVVTGADGGSHLLRSRPYHAGGSVLRGVVLTLIDVSDVMRASAELEAARKAAQAQREEIEQIYRQSPLGMALLDTDLRILRANDGIARIVGRDVSDLIDAPVARVLPQLASGLSEAAHGVLETGRPVVGAEVEDISDGDGAGWRIWRCDLHPYSRGGALRGINVVLQDITEARQRDEQLQRMMNELQHRVKNMLANVMALVRQTQRATKDPRQALHRIGERLQSLSDASSLLSMQNWEKVQLRALVKLELVDLYGAERADIGGPVVELNPRAALAFSMALHEMVTNAAKYGALTRDGGTVSVRWAIEDRGEGPDLILRWRETGGPPVEEPASTGFGSVLIEASFGSNLGGSVERRFLEEGVSYDIRLPLGKAVAGRGGELDAQFEHPGGGG